MTTADAKLIADLGAAEARATKGPWLVFRSGVGRTEKELNCPTISRVEMFGEHDYETRECVTDFWSSTSARWDADAAFIAAARNALPRLLALVRAQDAALRHAAIVACAPSARNGEAMAGALAGLRAALDELVPEWNADGLKTLGVTP